MAWQDNCFSWRSRLAGSRQDDVLNDAEFGVYGVSVRANRAILAFASPVMRALFYGPLSANNKNIITIKDEMGTVQGFMAMIDFIYDEDKYSIKDLLDGREEIGTIEDLARVMELLYFADKYQIRSLISFCRNLLIHKIKLNRGNMFSMYNVICKYNVLEVDYRIVTAQIKAVESAVVDIAIFSGFVRNSYATDIGQNIYRLKFKVNQDALLLFDQDKQYLHRKEDIVFHDSCETQDEEHHVSHYKSISWEPESGCTEIAKGTQINTTKFYAKANIENTLQFEVCHGEYNPPFGTYGFSNFSYAHNGKFKTDNLEIEIIEVNGTVFKEAVMSDEPIHMRMPMSVLSFQPLGAKTFIEDFIK